MSAPPVDAVRLQALDPGAGRKAKAGLAGLVVTLGILAWQPWESPDPAAAVVPAPSAAPAATDAADRAADASDGRTRHIPTRPFAPVRVAGLTADWGVAAYLERTPSERGDSQPRPRALRLRTFALDESFVRIDEPTAWYQACGDLYTGRSAAVVRSDRVRVLGVTMPQDAARARVTVTHLGGDVLHPRQVAGRSRRLEAERIRPPYALFALPRYRPWEPGIYRFDVHLPGGAFRYVYACIFY